MHRRLLRLEFPRVRFIEYSDALGDRDTDLLFSFSSLSGYYDAFDVGIQGICLHGSQLPRFGDYSLILTTR